MLEAHYREQGWDVERCANAQGLDRGIDFKLRRQSEYVLVHCKHWNAPQVAVITVCPGALPRTNAAPAVKDPFRTVAMSGLDDAQRAFTQAAPTSVRSCN